NAVQHRHAARGLSTSTGLGPRARQARRPTEGHAPSHAGCAQYTLAIPSATRIGHVSRSADGAYPRSVAVGDRFYRKARDKVEVRAGEQVELISMASRTGAMNAFVAGKLGSAALGTPEGVAPRSRMQTNAGGRGGRLPTTFMVALTPPRSGCSSSGEAGSPQDHEGAWRAAASGCAPR